MKKPSALHILWAGQSISILGTSMTSFGVMVWAFQITGTATSLAMLGFFLCLTYIIASPFAGVLVDRVDRRKVMFWFDLAAGLTTAALLALFWLGKLQIWHLYVAQGLVGIFSAFQEPAFGAAVTLLVSKDELTRSNALLGLGRSLARMFAPALAGLLMQFADLGSVMLVDLSTMIIGLGCVLAVRIPAAPRTQTGYQAEGSFWHEMRFGFRYILSKPGLSGLLGTFFLVNLFGTLTYFAVLSPMILARTGNDEVALSIVRSVMGLGGIAGGLLITVWGGPKNKVKFYLASTALSFLVSDFITATSRTTFGWSVAGFLSELTIPFIVSPYYALWQEIVPADVQGRVFSVRETVQVSSQPLGYLFGGLLADRLFEPALRLGGPLTGSVGLLVGSGPGAGMSAMFLFTSLFGLLTGVVGLLTPSVRNLESGVVSQEIGEGDQLSVASVNSAAE